jgi:hypothetical protein
MYKDMFYCIGTHRDLYDLVMLSMVSREFRGWCGKLQRVEIDVMNYAGMKLSGIFYALAGLWTNKRWPSEPVMVVVGNRGRRKIFQWLRRAKGSQLGKKRYFFPHLLRSLIATQAS